MKSHEWHGGKFCPQGEIQPDPLLTHMAEMNNVVGQDWRLPTVSMIFYHSSNERVVNIC